MKKRIYLYMMINKVCLAEICQRTHLIKSPKFCSMCKNKSEKNLYPILGEFTPHPYGSKELYKEETMINF